MAAKAFTAIELLPDKDCLVVHRSVLFICYRAIGCNGTNNKGEAIACFIGNKYFLFVQPQLDDARLQWADVYAICFCLYAE